MARLSVNNSRMAKIDAHQFILKVRVTLRDFQIAQTSPILTFRVAFRIVVVEEDREFKFDT